MGLSFLYYHYEVMYGVKWMSVENDRIVKMVSLYSIYLMLCLISLDDGESERSF